MMRFVAGHVMRKHKHIHDDKDATTHQCDALNRQPFRHLQESVAFWSRAPLGALATIFYCCWRPADASLPRRGHERRDDELERARPPPATPSLIGSRLVQSTAMSCNGCFDLWAALLYFKAHDTHNFSYKRPSDSDRAPLCRACGHRGRPACERLAMWGRRLGAAAWCEWPSRGADNTLTARLTAHLQPHTALPACLHTPSLCSHINVDTRKDCQRLCAGAL